MRYLFAVLLAAGSLARAQGPYFVTYTHHLEEPGNLEIASQQLAGSPQGGNSFLSQTTELEYGVKAWWTSELYLSSQHTSHEGGLYTGWRWENRLRPLMREHWINPVLYVEYQGTNGADKSIREVVGHDEAADQTGPNAETRHEHVHELETKLILSSNLRGWNVAENIIAEKNLAGAPWEFGYAVGVSRPLRMAASPDRCTLCRENFRAGVEMYGGLGTRHDFGLHDTSHYIAPAVSWTLPNGPTFSLSPGFGITDQSHRMLVRFAVAYEIQQFGRQMAQMWRAK